MCSLSFDKPAILKHKCSLNWIAAVVGHSKNNCAMIIRPLELE